jgi:uncharacterized protein (DUF58 family)
VSLPPEVLKKVKLLEINTRKLVNNLFAGEYHTAFKGQGMDFDEVREYQPGDEVRTIDWNVTARMNHPFVKKFREERELTVMLVVDLSGSGRFGSGQQSKRALMAELAAVLAFSAIRNQDKVGLLLFTETVEKFVHTIAAQRDHAADRVASADLESGDSLTSFGGHRLLAGNLDQIARGGLDQLFVSDRLAHAHVQRDLGDARNLHD